MDRPLSTIFCIFVLCKGHDLWLSLVNSKSLNSALILYTLIFTFFIALEKTYWVNIIRVFLSTLSSFYIILCVNGETMKQMEADAVARTVVKSISSLLLIILECKQSLNGMEMAIKAGCAVFVFICVCYQLYMLRNEEPFEVQGRNYRRQDNQATSQFNKYMQKIFGEKPKSQPEFPLINPIIRRPPPMFEEMVSPKRTHVNKSSPFAEGGPLCLKTRYYIKEPDHIFIDSQNMIRFTYNLKCWISKNILNVLLGHFESIERTLQENGYTNYKLGYKSLDFLKNLYSSSQMFHTATVKLVIQSLDLCSDQKYLIGRIIDMASGPCMIGYRSKLFDHRPDLPSDESIIFHLFCLYFNTQFQIINHGDGYFTQHYVVFSKSYCSDSDAHFYIKNSLGCSIYSNDYLNPSFDLIALQKKHYSNNGNHLLNTLVHFLLYIKKYNRGYLEGVPVDIIANDLLHCLENSQ